MKLCVYSEVCCDYCNEVEHSHFACPICGETYAPTDLYGEGVYDQGVGFVLSCENCKAEFRLIDRCFSVDSDDWDWELLPKG